MRKLHLGLHKQLREFEAEQQQIEEAIIEVQRRIAILDEVMSWSVPGVEAEQEYSAEFEYHNGESAMSSRGR